MVHNCWTGWKTDTFPDKASPSFHIGYIVMLAKLALRGALLILVASSFHIWLLDKSCMWFPIWFYTCRSVDSKQTKWSTAKTHLKWSKRVQHMPKFSWHFSCKNQVKTWHFSQKEGCRRSWILASERRPMSWEFLPPKYCRPTDSTPEMI